VYYIDNNDNIYGCDILLSQAKLSHSASIMYSGASSKLTFRLGPTSSNKKRNKRGSMVKLRKLLINANKL